MIPFMLAVSVVLLSFGFQCVRAIEMSPPHGVAHDSVELGRFKCAGCVVLDLDEIATKKRSKKEPNIDQKT